MTGVTSSDCTSYDEGKCVAHALSVVIPASSSHGEKLEKFNGTDFKRWQQNMLFYLTTLNLAKFLKEDAPTIGTTTEVVVAADAWLSLGVPLQELYPQWISQYFVQCIQSNQNCQSPVGVT
ncbi:unnamed protein product [Prunus brigantina]